MQVFKKFHKIDTYPTLRTSATMVPILCPFGVCTGLRQFGEPSPEFNGDEIPPPSADRKIGR